MGIALPLLLVVIVLIRPITRKLGIENSPIGFVFGMTAILAPFLVSRWICVLCSPVLFRKADQNAARRRSSIINTQ